MERDESALATLGDALGRRLERETDVLAAYLFGSQARGTARGHSDVDVAVLLADDDRGERRLELIADLSASVDAGDVDLVVLNDAPPALAYRVLSEGRLVLCRDEKARIRHWVRTVDRYLDMAPTRKMLEQGLRHRLEEGRFGRP